MGCQSCDGRLYRSVKTENEAEIHSSWDSVWYSGSGILVWNYCTKAISLQNPPSRQSWLSPNRQPETACRDEKMAEQRSASWVLSSHRSFSASLFFMLKYAEGFGQWINCCYWISWVFASKLEILKLLMIIHACPLICVLVQRSHASVAVFSLQMWGEKWQKSMSDFLKCSWIFF